MSLGATVLNEMAPQKWLDLQRMNADVLNIPPIGHESNTGFFSLGQLNAAGVQPYDSTVGLTILGNAGGAHIDRNDCPQSFTTMFPMGNLDDFENIDPSFFFFLELGIFIEMKNFYVIQFSGLHFHGGQAPRMSIKGQVPKAATRFVVVLYATYGAQSGTTPVVLGLTGARSRAEVTPAARFDPQLVEKMHQGSLNHMRDGRGTMTEAAYIRSSVRYMYLMLENMTRGNKHIKLNNEAMAELFHDKDGNVIPDLADWRYGPLMDDEAFEEATQCMADMNLARESIARTIPSQVHAKTGWKGIKRGHTKAAGSKKPRKVPAAKNKVNTRAAAAAAAAALIRAKQNGKAVIQRKGI